MLNCSIKIKKNYKLYITKFPNKQLLKIQIFTVIFTPIHKNLQVSFVKCELLFNNFTYARKNIKLFTIN